jgi:Zn-dependent M32 family carboxypeptidase
MPEKKFAIERSIATTQDTIRELDAIIANEDDQHCVDELKAVKEQLKSVLISLVRAVGEKDKED